MIMGGEYKLKLVPGIDYPSTMAEFNVMFSKEVDCENYLLQMRLDDFVCPKCKTAAVPWVDKRNRIICTLCGYRTGLKAGTVFEGSGTPLKKWFEAAMFIVLEKNGVSAKSIERELKVSYATAWSILHKFRVAMVNSERRRLSGSVEVDETYYLAGSNESGKRGRGTDRELVVLAVEVLPKSMEA
jgi:transposase-like protein